MNSSGQKASIAARDRVFQQMKVFASAQGKHIEQNKLCTPNRRSVITAN
jgi:hypothetical protein